MLSTSTRRIALVVALAAALIAQGVTRAEAAPDPLAAAQARITEAQAAADKAAVESNDAESHYYTLEAEIGRTQRTITQLRADAERLRSIVQRRAIVAYKGGGQQPLDGLLGDAVDALDVGRRAVLFNQANATSQSAIDEFRATTDDLRARESSLEQQINAQATTLEELRARHSELQDNLDAAVQAQEELRAELERQRRASEFAALVRQAQAAARARAQPTPPSQPTEPPPSGGGGGGGGRPVGGGGWTCPVQGPVSFSNDYGAPRGGGRTHKGNDMFAARGTPVVAVLSGSVFFQGDPLGGLAAYVQASDGNTYYYAHLNDYVGGARSVSAGELIGHVGSTGTTDAPPHLHFEIRIGGPNGERINPYPTISAHC